MIILFLGEEGAYESAVESGIREGGSPIFFSSSLPEPGLLVSKGLDAVIVPAQRFLAMAPLQLPVPVLASGPPSLLAECLAAGCADYLREPWSIDEVEARLSRHTGSAGKWPENTGSWDGSVLSGPGGQQRLSPGLSTLLDLLLANRGACVTREALSAILGSSGVQGRSIDMQMSRLRGIFNKLGLDSAARELRSNTDGYCFSFPCK
ncbi:MAG: hypothetical protein A3J97_03870 [Spirochaetes bacterium RIFOXYC1_FULL_54_7]|nr:MAG: hypothetical protein A3J97_03870 [Spirochaetes bacterium RIFOXYC1_FULL_54_7]